MIPKVNFDSNGELILKGSQNSSENDFDFYVGNWNVKNKKIKTRFVNSDEWIEFDTKTTMYKALHGFSNIDHNVTNIDGQPFKGMSVRFFNPETKLWSIHRADTNTLKLDKPTVGSFDNEYGHFFTKDNIEERDVVVVYRWDVRDKNNPIWSQAFSTDNGETWEWNWFMYFVRNLQ